jgi:ABC-2 type transport system ATP-binding protein
MSAGAPGTTLAPPPESGGTADAQATSASGPEREETAYPLAIRGIHKRWRRNLPPVLDGLDLVLEPGTRTWIGGRNGVGKTTLLRIAAGLIDAEAGRIEVWGVSPRENRARYQRLVSFLPAGDRGLYARLTVARQLELCARLALLRGPDCRQAVRHAIQAFDLAELADRRVDRMSMGQRQRLRIAMTFLADPEIVLLDEPLTSLDGDGAELLGFAIDRLIAREGALLWCSPSGEQLDMPFDRRWTIERGRLVAT